MGINLLNSEIINMIAAGEVIENPAAVVKELIENSIDANADLIEIDIENYGLKKIQLKDNGIGISKEDLLKAPIRYATSKIKDFNDLYNIKTMGFRGEALASIFSIAKTKIITKKKGSENSYEISFNNLNEVLISSGDFGTTIIVEDLFYNTPARKKYLKSETREFKEILDVVNRFLIIYNEIKFVLRHNGKLVINKPKFNSNLDNIYYVLGKDLRDNILGIKNQFNGLRINGFISNPSNLTYPVKKNQYIYINKRFVKSKLIRDAIYEGYGTNLMEGRHPFFVLDIEIDPEIIDVNIHPTKIEVKFENELEIYNFILNSVKKIFENQVLFKSFETKKFKEEISLDKIEALDINKSNKFNENLKKKEKNYFTKDIQKELNFQNEILNENNNSYEKSEMKKPLIEEVESNNFEKNDLNNSFGPLYKRLKDYRIVGQINKTFIILETPNEMIIIDQHVAEEKFYYENFKKELENKKISKQILLKPEIFNLSKSEFMLFKENYSLLKKIGFEIDEFSSDSIIVRAVPIGIKGKLVEPSLIKDILYEISIDNKFKLLEDKKIEKLASMACKKSIKAGRELTNNEIKIIVEQLKRLKEPFNCPHGRPILLNWSFKDLEKKFKRIV